jgi:hypothetical protein
MSDATPAPALVPMDQPDTNPIPRRSTDEIRELLCERFPLVFRPKHHQKLPLAISIHKGLAALMPDVRPHQLSAAIFNYCKGPTYLTEILCGADRYNLNGRPEGAVSQRDEDHATEKLRSYGDSLPTRFRPGICQIEALRADTARRSA